MPKYLRNNQGLGFIPIVVLIAAAGILLFLFISNTFDFKDKLFNALFPKPPSHAQEATTFGPLNTTLPSAVESKIPDQYIVSLKPGSNPHALAQQAQTKHGVGITHIYEHAILGFAFKGSAQAAEALKHNPNVQSIEQDTKAYVLGQVVSNEAKRVAVNQNSTAKVNGINEPFNINIAIMDTGIDYTTQPDLNVVGGVDCGGFGTYADGYGHGTSVAGVAAAIDNDIGVVGVAPGARLWSVRAADNTGHLPISAIVCGIDWATGTRTDTDTTNDIAVVNMSFYGYSTDSNGNPIPADDGNCGYTNEYITHQAICNSIAKGVVYVAAAGNSNIDTAYLWPAGYSEVIAVSAIADNDGAAGGKGGQIYWTDPGPDGVWNTADDVKHYETDDTLASFSNYGSAVDIAAPGVLVLTTLSGGRFGFWIGTSFSAPFVTGAVALYVANNGLVTDAAGVAAIRSAIVTPANNYSVTQNDPRGFTGDKDTSAEPLLYLATPGYNPSPTPTPTSGPTSTPTTGPTPTSPPPTPTPTSTPVAQSLTISNISSTTTATSATITWTTDQPSTSQLNYGTTTSLGQLTTLNPNLVTTHSLTLTGLTKQARYYFKVFSKNSAGLETSSSIQQFRTKNR